MLLTLTGFLLSSQLYIEELVVPDGFKIELFADDVVNARQMAMGDNGTIFVGTRKEGNVYALVDNDNDGKADKRYLIDDDLNMPSGVAYRDGALYVAAVNRILRYDDIENRLAKPPQPVVVIDDLPDDSHHGWKAIEFSPSGTLYIPIGVPCNICISDDERHGTIIELNIKTGKYRTIATGVRNSVGLAFNPTDSTLWFTDNGRDWLGDDSPPDEINHATASGLNFGFPYLHGKDTLDPEYGEQAKTEDYTLPAVELGAHVAPLGLAFYTASQFPKKYQNNLFVAEHGSWNRSEKAGYRVIHIQLKDNRVIKVEPFITGWLDKEKDSSWGRPVDVLVLPDGSMLISDDYADAIYRISYQEKIKSD
jgi:glucose/arabinose dehydrogenase